MQATIDFARRWAKALAVLLAGLAVNLGGGPVWAAPPGNPWGGNYFPNAELTDQDGRKLHFYDDLLKDKVVAINFIYTHCTDSCSLETAALRKVQKAMGERVGRDVFFYTVSIDGDRDKPEQLKAYAEKFHAGPGWSFLTGRKEDVVEIRKKLGMYRAEGEKAEGLNAHNIHVMMGNEKTGQWIKRSPFEETAALVRVLTVRLPTEPSLAGPVHEHMLPMAQSTGEELFRSNCSVCHSTGSEDNIGPGLAGITQKRDAKWLKRMIQTPDRLIAQKDPIASDLFKKYNQVYMPNLRLADKDVAALVDFLGGLTPAAIPASQ